MRSLSFINSPLDVFIIIFFFLSELNIDLLKQYLFLFSAAHINRISDFLYNDFSDLHLNV